MTCENHLIEISIDENTIFSREIVLINGTVKNPCAQQYIEYFVNDSKHITKQLISNDAFKFLIRLDRDTINVLKIRYCEKEIDIKLQHKQTQSIFYDIQPLYIIPKNHDGRFQSDDPNTNCAQNAIKKINLILELAQCITSSKIFDIEHVEKSFVLQKCEIFNCNELDLQEARTINQWDLYDKIALELIQKYGTDVVQQRKFVGFMSCTRFLGLNGLDYNYINIKNKTEVNPSLGIGFLALLGNGVFYALPNHLDEVIPSFQNKTIVDTSILLDDSNYRKTYGGCFSTFLGSLIHEMGHTFDLGHTINGLMGTDIDYAHRFFLCQNFTEIMPKRNISDCQQMKKNESILSNRITRIKKNGAYMEKYHEQKNKDLTYFESNCLIILMNHKWFTQNKQENIISYDASERKIISQQAELVLIEIRESLTKNAILRNFWDLRDQKLSYFQLTDDISLSNVTVFAINTSGCCLTKHFNNVT